MEAMMTRVPNPPQDEADIGSGERTPEEQEKERGKILHQHPEGQDDALNEAEAELEMIEQNADTDEEFSRAERESSLDKDEPDSQLDALDPVPPKGK